VKIISDWQAALPEMCAAGRLQSVTYPEVLKIRADANRESAKESLGQ